MSDFISYGRQWLDERDIQAVVEVLKSDFLTQGPKVKEFEAALCRYTGAKYCVAVANGTAALHLAALALEIAPGQEGITTPNTFAASANCLIYAGLKPVLADIRADTYNIDFAEIQKKVTPKTKVIVAVDFAGQAAEMEKIYPWAKKKGIRVIEDAAHAIGSKYADGSRVGSCRHADLTTFSFHPVKTITTGEGGAITTNDLGLYQQLILLRTHGITKDPELLSANFGPWYYEMQELGFNYRLSDIQAALGLSQLKKLDRFASRRREIVQTYNRAFSSLKFCRIPYEQNPGRATFHLYVLLIDFAKLGKDRSQVMGELKEAGIGSQVHYIPIHLHPYYRQNYASKKGDYPKAEAYYDQALSLPLSARLTFQEVNRVIEAVKRTVDG